MAIATTFTAANSGNLDESALIADKIMETFESNTVYGIIINQATIS